MQSADPARFVNLQAMRDVNFYNTLLHDLSRGKHKTHVKKGKRTWGRNYYSVSDHNTVGVLPCAPSCAFLSDGRHRKAYSIFP